MNNQTKVTLYGVIEEMDALDALLESVNDEKDTESALQLQAQITDLLQSKLDKCYGYDQSLADAIELIEKREEELAKAKKILKNKKKKFKEYLLFCLDRLNVTEIKGKMAQLKIGAASQSVEVTDETLLPPNFLRTKTSVEIDKSSLKEALKDGSIVPGARLVFGERRLTFKVKTN